MAATYLKITRDEFEDWLYEICPVFERAEKTEGVYFCPMSPYVAVRISDEGEGITAENLKHLFEPFFSTKEMGKGTGLGLSIAYGIVEDHGGWIDVETRPGQGTSFRVFLPLEADQ